MNLNKTKDGVNLNDEYLPSKPILKDQFVEPTSSKSNEASKDSMAKVNSIANSAK